MEAILVGAFFLSVGFTAACLWHGARAEREERIAEKVAERIAKGRKDKERW